MNTEEQWPGDALHAELTAFAFERDQSFRRRDSDIFEYNHPPYKRKARILCDDDDENLTYDIFDERTLSLTGEYSFAAIEKASLSERKIIFTLGLSALTQIDTIPDHLSTYFDTATIDHYADKRTWGDLNVEQSLTYTLRHSPLDNDHVIITPQESYRLYDNDDLLHEATYPSSKHAPTRVPLAHEQRTLVVPAHIEEDASNDPSEQASYDAHFHLFAQYESDALFTTRQRDAAFIIRALMRTLGSSKPIPDFETFSQTIARRTDNS